MPLNLRFDSPRVKVYSVRMFKKFLALTVAAAMFAPAFAAEWMSDFNAAKAKAQAEHKLILMDFTGSDWCHWCIKLRSEVLDKPDFEAYAKDKFVLMEVDVPRNANKLTPEIKAQNQQLCSQYKVNGYPTMLVVTYKGTVVGGFSGYRKIEDLKMTLDKAIKAHADMKAAHKLPDAEKEAALDAVYATMESPALAAGGYKTKAKENAEQQLKEFEAKIMACKTADEWLKTVDECLAVTMPQNKRYLLDQKFTALVNCAETIEDIKAAEKVGREILETLPAQVAAQVKQQLDRDFADPAAMLERMKKMRAESAQEPAPQGNQQ